MNIYSKPAKKIFLILISGIVALCYSSCTQNPHQDFVESKQGYLFKTCLTHSQSPRPQKGDILVGEITIKLNDSVELFSNFGTPKRLFSIKEPTEGSLDEFFLSVHLNDSVIIISPAEYVCSLIPDLEYRAGDKLYYYFKLHSIISQHQKTEEEQRNETALAEEQATIQAYIEKKHITIPPDSSGLYFRLLKRSSGPLAQPGNKVKVFYTAKLLNDSIVQTNMESVAKQHKLDLSPAILKPFEFILGDDGIITAWTETLIKMKEGEQAQIIVPSRLAYGKEGSRLIPPYTPLVFDLHLISIESQK